MLNGEKMADFAARPEWTNRLHKIKEHDYRSKFQRDRDRILYSKEFRRLNGKTQVFVAGFDDNIRTRLTHTLEVAQIANTISIALGLNTELTEAIALGHDVGHTPFGHVGERTLNLFMNGCLRFYGYEENLKDEEKGFKHNLQGAKVVTKLEKMNDSEPGLNLTLFTIWGIVNHTSQSYKRCEYLQEKEEKCRYKNQLKECSQGELKLDYYKSVLKHNGSYILDDKRDWTFEALVVGISDEIAQRHHDIEDGVYAGIIDSREIINHIVEHFDNLGEKEREALQSVKDPTGHDSRTAITAIISKVIIDMYVTDAIESIRECLLAIKKECKIGSSDDFFSKRDQVYDYLTRDKKTRKHKNITDALSFSECLVKNDKKFKDFLMSHILQSELAQSMDGKAAYIIRQLIKAYLTNPQQLPDATIIRLVGELKASGRRVKFDDTKGEATVASQARQILQRAMVNDTAKTRHILLRTVCDYIAGMTDQYAYKQFNKLYGTGMVISN